MRVRDAFIDIPNSGECSIDHQKMLRAFNMLCRILEYYVMDNGKRKREFALVEYTLGGKRKLRLTISQEDASWIVGNFSLTPIRNTFGEVTYLKV